MRYYAWLLFVSLAAGRAGASPPSIRSVVLVVQRDNGRSTVVSCSSKGQGSLDCRELEAPTVSLGRRLERLSGALVQLDRASAAMASLMLEAGPADDLDVLPVLMDPFRDSAPVHWPTCLPTGLRDPFFETPAEGCQ